MLVLFLLPFRLIFPKWSRLFCTARMEVSLDHCMELPLSMSLNALFLVGRRFYHSVPIGHV
jgi:hypothetical protein